MPCGWEGNCWSGIALAMRHRQLDVTRNSTVRTWAWPTNVTLSSLLGIHSLATQSDD